MRVQCFQQLCFIWTFCFRFRRWKWVFIHKIFISEQWIVCKGRLEYLSLPSPTANRIFDCNECKKTSIIVIINLFIWKGNTKTYKSIWEQIGLSVHRLPSSLQLNQNQSFRDEAKKRDKTGKVVNAPIPSRASRLTTERFLRQWGRAAVGLVADGATGTRFGAKRASEMHGLGHIIQLYNLASELCFITLINRQSTIKDGGSLELRHPKFRPSWIHQWTYRIGPLVVLVYCTFALVAGFCLHNTVVLAASAQAGYHSLFNLPVCAWKIVVRQLPLC